MEQLRFVKFDIYIFLEVALRVMAGISLYAYPVVAQISQQLRLVRRSSKMSQQYLRQGGRHNPTIYINIYSQVAQRSAICKGGRHRQSHPNCNLTATQLQPSCNLALLHLYGYAYQALRSLTPVVVSLSRSRSLARALSRTRARSLSLRLSLSPLLPSLCESV